MGWALLQHENEYVRAWTVQLLCETKHPSETTRLVFGVMARTETSPIVRLYLAAAAQRMPPEQRWDIVAALTAHGEDAGDRNLPLMDWYASEPLATLDPESALSIGLASPLPNQLRFTARRTAAIGTPAALRAVAEALDEAPEEAKQLAILHGLNEALKPGHPAPMPPGWDELATR